MRGAAREIEHPPAGSIANAGRERVLIAWSWADLSRPERAAHAALQFGETLLTFEAGFDQLQVFVRARTAIGRERVDLQGSGFRRGIGSRGF